jgi:hypothetical protein
MVSDKARERAAETWLIEEKLARHTHRAVKTQWQAEDLFGADVIGFIPTGFALVQATTTNGVSGRLKRMERRDGEAFVPPRSWEQRYLLAWRSERDPDDGRRRNHFFRVYLLLASSRAKERERWEADGRSRRPRDGWVWARRASPIGPIPDDWYSAA